MGIERIVLKMGGSILFPETQISLDHLQCIGRGLCDFIIEVKNINEVAKICIVIGGGAIARQYISVAEKMGVNAYLRDELGIEVTRLNAKLISYVLKTIFSQINRDDLAEEVAEEVPKDGGEVLRLLKQHDIVMIGGFFPGQSTIGPAALTAEVIHADLLIIATNVPGIYTEDPAKKSDAKRITRISPKELRALLVGYEAKPGTYKVIDLVAIKVIERSKIPTIIVDGREVKNIIKAFKSYVKGEFKEIETIGTLIVS